jgi:uncharacterized protein (DUF433 family)
VKANAAQPLVNPWETPAYTAADTGRLVGLSATRVRRWLHGYEYDVAAAHPATSRRVKQRPVVYRGEVDPPFASFLDLIDLLFVKKFLDAGISLQKLRKAMDEADRLIGGHHFAQRSFFTDGRNIYLQVRDKAEALLQLLTGGQWVIAPLIKQLSTEIKFHEATGFAERWFPLGPDASVVLDPRIAFGAPTVVNRGIETANVYDLFVAERKRVAAVVSWLGLNEREIEDAVEFESRLNAA